jgi:23S rRNA (guanosine2251-2'-O)-methyltransferase
LEHINIVIASNLVMAFKELKEAGYWIIGMDMDTRYDISKIREYDKVVLVMGSEGQGLRRLTIESCDITMKIVMDPKMESLNVSNAAAIAMHMHTCQNI